MPGAPHQLFARPRIEVRRESDGTMLLGSAEPMEEPAPSMAHLFRAGSEAHSDRVLATRREGDGRRALTWGEARTQADALGQALLEHGLGPRRPLMVLSGNSLEHLLLLLAGYTAGVPVLPISAAYSLQSTDHERVRAIAVRCAPGMVFADDGDAFAPALAALAPTVPVQLVARGAGSLRLDELRAATPGPQLDEAFAGLGPDTVAKLLFTSGSTGAPKGVINTHRMLCSNQQALAQVWPFLRDEPPVLVDWLPWSHTFGGNHNLGQVLANGGTIHIDDGRPVPALFDRTLEALAETPPTVYYNVPAGYALLTPRLEQDPQFAAAFLSRLRFMFYAAAALPLDLWQRLRAVADEVADREVPLTASWGATETAPAATTAHFADAPCGCIGVPLPGVTIKLAPVEDKLEIRVAGPNVTPGYHGDPDATAAAFDADGFYRTGDAARLLEEDDPTKGLLFDGRLSEDFKLTTGTWVSVGRVRDGLVSAAGGVLSHAVIAGHDRDHIAAMAWVDRAAAKRTCDADEDISLADPRLAAHLAGCLARANDGAGSARRIERLLLLVEPPDMDRGEITDKGYVNQRAVLRHRSELVARLFAADGGGAEVIITSPA